MKDIISIKAATNWVHNHSRRTMNFKLLLVAVAVCLMLASGTEGYRRRHAGYERKVFRELGEATEEGLDELAASLEEDLNAFAAWLNSFRRRR